MSDAPRRPILKLKIDPPPRPAPEPAPPKPAAKLPAWAKPAGFAPRRVPSRPPPRPAPEHAWKCKPCGAAFTPARELGDEDPVRCPSCNARLGRAGDFRADPPRVEKLRARLAKK